MTIDIHQLIDIGKQRKNTILVAATIIILLATYSQSLIAFISPSSELRWNTELQGLSASYSRGSTVSLTGFLEEGTEYIQDGDYFVFTTPETVTWTITIKDSNNMPVFFETGQLTDLSGDFTLPAETYDIAVDAATGTYTVKLIVWSALLPSGNTRTYIINEGSFEVTT
jgi:hypothetical protein